MLGGMLQTLTFVLCLYLYLSGNINLCCFYMQVGASFKCFNLFYLFIADKKNTI